MRIVVVGAIGMGGTRVVAEPSALPWDTAW
jgi:hypothetical protein